MSREGDFAQEAVVEDFTITRAGDGGAGYQTAMLRPPEPHQPSFTVAAVVEGSPAWVAGIRERHIGWIISHVEGVAVTADTGAAALDATRAPGRTFTVTLRRPRTGDFTVELDAEGEVRCRRHVNSDDMRVQVQSTEDGRTTVSVELAPQLVEMLTSSGNASMLDVRRQLQAHMDQVFAHMREQRTPEEIAEQEREELEAAQKDVEAPDDSSRCAVCLDMQHVSVLVPCRHLATCHRCTVRVRRLNKCPICRSSIENIVLSSELVDGDVVYKP